MARGQLCCPTQSSEDAGSGKKPLVRRGSGMVQLHGAFPISVSGDIAIEFWNERLIFVELTLLITKLIKGTQSVLTCGVAKATSSSDAAGVALGERDEARDSILSSKRVRGP